MKRTDEQMRQDALHNLETLIKKRGLNPNVKKYFEEGMIYYSYLTAGGFIGSIDTIDYDARYPEIVKDFERKNDALVYHVIESGNLLSLLYVDRHYRHRLQGRRIFACVYNLDYPGFHESGSITLDSLNGALIRTDLYYCIA